MSIEEARAKLARQAVTLEIGGFRPPADLRASWFGKVHLAAPGEEWPMSGGRPMHALCQLNFSDFPFRPEGLKDIEFLSVFIGPDQLPDSTPNGVNWCLRTYKSLQELVPLAQLDSGSEIRPFPMRAKLLEEDYPMWDDVEIDIPDEIEDAYYDHFSNTAGFKVGGWPTLIQSEIYWAPLNKHPAEPRYQFQIDSTEKGNWMWGDSGVGYFGRGTAPGYRETWACEWQCY